MPLIADTITVMCPPPHASQCVLRNLDLKIAPGEIVAVAGRPGTGKSTLVAVLSGAVAPNRGKVYVDGPPAVDGLDPCVSALFERPEEMFLADSVEGEVALALQVKGSDAATIRERVAEALRAVELEPHRYGGRRPGSLSSGEQRRLALAILLAVHPAYLCLDEPGAGLDAGGMEAVERVLRKLKSAGIGILVTGRDTDLLWSVSDRVVVLENGTLAEECPTGHSVELAELLGRHGIALPGGLKLWSLLLHRKLIDTETPPTIEAMTAALSVHTIPD